MESIKSLIETITTSEVEKPHFRYSLRERFSSTPVLNSTYFGDEIPNDRAKSQGWTIWDMRGKPREIWETNIHPRVKEVLERYATELCRKARVQPVAGLHGWITGKSKSTACPTIVIICRDRHYRNVARSLIRDRGLIDLLVEENIFFKVMALACFIGRPAKSWVNRSVFSSEKEIGPSIFGLSIRVPSSDGTEVSKARLGGLVFLDERPYGMTVAHVFEGQHGQEPPSAIEFSDSDTDEEEDGDWGWSASSSSDNGSEEQLQRATRKNLMSHPVDFNRL
jgi:hypothetical protein